MDSFVNDLRHGLRTLVKSPGFSVVAVAILALGIGATTTAFSWIRGMLLEPLPGVADQERVVIFYAEDRHADPRALSVPDYRDITASDLPFAGVLAHDLQSMHLTIGDSPERAWGEIVSGNYFDLLGVRPALGRTFRPEEDGAPARYPVVVVSHRFWQRRLAGDPGVVGRAVRLNGQPFTIVGVAAEGFIGSQVGLSTDLWVPLAMQPVLAGTAGGDRLAKRGNRWMQGLARLAPGVGLDEAQAALDTFSLRLAEAHPAVSRGIRYRVWRFWNAPVGASGVMMPALLVLAVMATLLLLLACANVANLLLVRALGRRRETAVRLALGASRWRLVRQLLAESLLLVAAAGAAGVAIAHGAVHLLVAVVPPADVPVEPVFAVDGQVLAFACVAALLTGLAFSLAPALQAARPKVAIALREEGGSVAGGGMRARLRGALVVAQIALSSVLLICAGLFLRSIDRAAKLDPGFTTRDALLAAIDLPPNRYDEARGNALYRELVERVAALPGVESATLASRMPLDFGGSSSYYLEIDGYTPAPEEEVIVRYFQVGPDYLKTMGIDLVDGRDVAVQDDAAAPGVLIVNQTMASRYWPAGQALGSTVRIADRAFTVVGIARDGKYSSLNEPPRPFFYLPVLQMHRSEMILIARTGPGRGEPLDLAPAVAGTIRQLDRDLPLAAVRSLGEHLRISVLSQRLAASFLGVVGLLALVLATVGLYSVVRYAAAQRRREMGVLVALGARRSDLARLVLTQGLALVAAGAVVGLAFAFGLTRFLSGLLLGVSATDPLILLGAPAMLAAIALLACWLPAREAAEVDPVVVLRSE